MKMFQLERDRACENQREETGRVCCSMWSYSVAQASIGRQTILVNRKNKSGTDTHTHTHREKHTQTLPPRRERCDKRHREGDRKCTDLVSARSLGPSESVLPLSAFAVFKSKPFRFFA